MLGAVVQKALVEVKSSAKNEFDSPWKNILELLLENFFEFFFPKAHSEIDWGRGFEFLDKEFQKILRDAEVGSRLADKLVKVWTKDDTEVWVLLHVEVQGDRELGFSERMFIYYYRIYDRYRCKIASLAILTDGNPNWRPQRFSSELWNCRMSFDYPVVKLMDYCDKWSYLEKSSNPFAIVVMAHLLAKQTKNDNDRRLAVKVDLTRRLYKKGYKKESIINLFLFIDWVMNLPRDLEQKFREEIEQYEELSKMRYVSSIERLAKEEGIALGQEKMRTPWAEGLKFMLELKFGKDGAQLFPILSQLKSAEELIVFQDRLKTAKTASELKKFYQS